MGAGQLYKGTTPGEWSDFASWQSVLEVLTGFLNSTEVTFGSNRTECQVAIEGIYSSAMNGTAILLGDPNTPINYFDFWLAFDEYLLIPYNLHTVFYGCYTGAKEIWALLIDYTFFVQDLNILFFNVIYNLGPLAKNVTNLALYFIA